MIIHLFKIVGNEPISPQVSEMISSPFRKTPLLRVTKTCKRLSIEEETLEKGTPSFTSPFKVSGAWEKPKGELVFFIFLF